MTCLMNECPTRVRIGSPPCSRITSGTVHEQIRLCTILAPGSRSSIAIATSAVSSEPLTSWARSSTRNTRSASPSNASPTSAPCSSTAAFRSCWFVGIDRIGRVVRERAVEVGEQMVQGHRQPLHDGGHDEPAHAVGRVGDDGERTHGADVDERQHVLDVRLEQVAALDRARAFGRRAPLPARRCRGSRAARSPRRPASLRPGRTSGRCTASGCGSR